MASDGKDVIPSWDGSARTWRRYTREVAWFFRATPSHKRRYVATKLLSRLTGSARLLAMSWTDMALDDYDGTRTLLRRLSASPLVRQSLPNASAICSQYFDFKRRPGEPMTAFLVRESLGDAEFVESLVRLAEEKKGSSSETSDFGLPPKPHDDAGWEHDEWSHDDGGLGWFWQHDQDDVGVQTSPASAAAGPVGDSGSPVYQRVPRDSPPSRRSAGVQPSFFAEDKTEINELTFAGSFVLGVLRGFRILQAAGLTPDERRVILSSTRGSLEFEEITKALQTLWDEQFAGQRHQTHQAHFQESFVAERDEHEDQFWEDANYAEDWSYYDSSWDWPETYVAEQIPEEPQENPEDDAAIREAQQAEKVAESLAVEASVLGVRHSVPPQP